MRHVCLLAAMGALAVALVPQATARHQHPGEKTRETTSARAASTRMLREIRSNRDETWRWQRLMRRPRTAYAGTARRARSVAYRRWVRNLWVRRARRARTRAMNPPHKRQWLCIHRYEGAWDDPNAPYYGGLQMDREFQATYGPRLLRAKGTADHWTPLEQMWVAERAYRTRGFYPWPNTARYCGLL